jgi:hypothetical protein
MSDTPTDIETRTSILADFFIQYKGNASFSDFFVYNDLGLPLAYALDSGIVARTDLSDAFVNETFELLLEACDISEDDGFETLEDVVISIK